MAEHIWRTGAADTAAAADAAWAADDTIHVAARWLRDPALGIVADTYDRAARAPHGQVPGRTRHGDRLRAAAKLIAATSATGSG